MIFARRAIQRRLDELRPLLGEDSVSKLAARLNKPGKDRLAAMWEVVTLHGLSKIGDIQHEIALESGRRPDIYFLQDDLSFTADVTAVSDDGLHERNPAAVLSRLIEEEKTRLGLPIGGLDLQIDSKTRHTSRGSKTVLCLPPRSRLRGFVRDKISPQIQAQMNRGTQPIRFSIKDIDASLRITIDPNKGPFSSMSHPSYSIPSIPDNNPLYGALKAKAKQLRDADGLVGVIVGDSSTQTMGNSLINHGGPNGGTIVNEFLRQHSSMDFVLLISVREEQYVWHHPHGRAIWLEAVLSCRDNRKIYPRLEPLFMEMLTVFPKPIQMPINALHRAKESGFGLGHHGGFVMSGNAIKVSAREVLEVLSGRCTVEKINRKYGRGSEGGRAGPDSMPQLIEHYLSQGRMPAKISIIKTDENDCDDWIEFEFGPPDPAITPFL